VRQGRLFRDFQHGIEQVERLIQALESELTPLVQRLCELTDVRSEDLEKLLADARESVRGNL
jgi:predicted  nucleic acid-binding Zn-ribbon protein